MHFFFSASFLVQPKNLVSWSSEGRFFYLPGLWKDAAILEINTEEKYMHVLFDSDFHPVFPFGDKKGPVGGPGS